MVKFVLTELLSSYATNQDGDVLFEQIRSAFEKNQKVTISFSNVHGLNSSFVNSAFIQLLEYYDFNQITKNLNFIDSNKQINSLIVSRFKFETAKCSM